MSSQPNEASITEHKQRLQVYEKISSVLRGLQQINEKYWFIQGQSSDEYPSSLFIHTNESNPTKNSIENTKKSCKKALNILFSYETPTSKFMSGKDIDKVLSEFLSMDKYQANLVKKALQHLQRYNSLTTKKNKKILEMS